MSKIQKTIAEGGNLLHVRLTRAEEAEIDDAKHQLRKPHFVVQDDAGGPARRIAVESPEGQRFAALHPELADLELAPLSQDVESDSDDSGE